jgi:hypothetical protein
MTTLQARAATPIPRKPVPPAGDPGVRHLIVRLRAAAGRLVAFSETRVLLREAAWTIERLERGGSARHG